jgi:hypothetical protein
LFVGVELGQFHIKFVKTHNELLVISFAKMSDIVLYEESKMLPATTYEQISDNEYRINSAVYGELQVNKLELGLYQYSNQCYELGVLLDNLSDDLYDRYPTLEHLDNDKAHLETIFILGFSTQSQWIYKTGLELNGVRNKTKKEQEISEEYRL